MGNLDFGTIAITFIVFLFSTACHEAAHAWMAWKWGDSTAKDLGRVTLNPIPHIDLVGTIIVPLLGLLSGGGLIGWASTPVNKYNMRDPRWGDFWTSAAGPITNLILAIISFTLLKVLLRTSLGASLGDYEEAVSMFLWTGVWLNLLLMVLNLLPIPPLDGSNLLQNLLPDTLAEAYEKIRPYGLILLVLIGVTGTLGKIVSPVIAFAKSLL